MPPLKPEGPKPELRPETSPAEPGPSFGRERSSRPAPYFSPPPNLQRPGDSADSQSSGKSSGARRLVALGMVAAAIMVGAWIGLSAPDEPPSNPPVAAATNEGKSWFVAAADVDQKATDHLKALLSGAGGGGAAGADELDAQNAPALVRLAEAAPQIAADVESGQRRLYRVHLLDFAAQDGDFVELFVDGVSFGSINLSNAGTSILLPVAPGKPMDMKMVATADGGGGVTVAFVSSAGEARTSVMQVGGFESWQVILK